MKINKSDAAWLKKATYKDRYDDRGLGGINVSDTKRFGHVAVATDGHRLHVVGVPDDIPCGTYQVYATGKLKPASTISRYPDWQYIVASDKAFAYPCDTLDKCEKLAINNYPDSLYYAFGQVKVSAQFANDAASCGKPYRIDAQDKPAKPIRIKFLCDRVQFAIIMPVHWPTDKF